MNDNTKKNRKHFKNHESIFNIFTFLPFVAKPTDQRTKYLQNRCSFMRGICTKKIGAISKLGAEIITFPPKPDGQTYSQTDRRTDICFYRVALLLMDVVILFYLVKTNHPYMEYLKYFFNSKEMKQI